MAYFRSHSPFCVFKTGPLYPWSHTSRCMVPSWTFWTLSHFFLLCTKPESPKSTHSFQVPLYFSRRHASCAMRPGQNLTETLASLLPITPPPHHRQVCIHQSAQQTTHTPGMHRYDDLISLKLPHRFTTRLAAWTYSISKPPL